MTPLSVPASIHMEDLLKDTSLCKIVARNHADLLRILTQTQLDIVNEQNRDTVGPTLLGIKHIQDIFSLFKAKGDVLIEKENKQ